MAATTIAHLALRGIVCAVPGEPVNAAEICRAVPLEDAPERARQMGLGQLHRAPPGQTTADLCTAAARQLLRRLDWSPASLDGIIVVTQTPDYFLPNTASVLHAALGLPTTCLAFDIGMGCSGFIYGLWMAGQFIASRSLRRVLLLVGDTLSQLVNPEDAHGMLVGDGAAAVALEWDPEVAPASFVLRSDGKGVPHLMVEAGAFRHRNGDGSTFLHMNGWELFKAAVSEVPGLVKEALTLHGWSQEAVDLFLFHQANGVITQHLTRACGLTADKVPANVSRYGNTSGVTIPLLLADAARDQVTLGPQQVVLAAFGVGYACGAAALTLGPLQVAEVLQIDHQEGNEHGGTVEAGLLPGTAGGPGQGA